MLAIVAVGKIAVAVHVDVAVARDEQIGAGAENRTDVRMVTDGERFLDDVVLRRRYVLVVNKGEEEGLFRGDVVVSLRARTSPGDVAETPADLASGTCRERKQRIYLIVFRGVIIIDSKEYLEIFS